MPITDENRELALAENDRMAAAGERVMVVARRDFDPATFDPKANLIELVTDLTLMAMVGIVDPPRAEAKDAIAKCHSAGIQVRMITGDHAVTAAAIGHQLGIEGTALTGAQFKAKSDDELMKELPDIGVVARVAPEDKIRLVDLLQRQQNIVAMTGDGVNDAPALKKADIGVAMGITGTEVSKGAAVMILTDDNFATIVKAVEFGRAIYDNLAKFIRFQMTALVAFIAAYLGAAFFVIARRRALYAGRRPVDQLPGAGAHRHRPGLRQACTRSDGAQAAAAQPTRALALAMGAHHLHRPADGGWHPDPGGSLLSRRAPRWQPPWGSSSSRCSTSSSASAAAAKPNSVFNRDILSDRHQLMLYGLALLFIFLPTELGFRSASWA